MPLDLEEFCSLRYFHAIRIKIIIMTPPYTVMQIIPTTYWLFETMGQFSYKHWKSSTLISKSRK